MRRRVRNPGFFIESVFRKRPCQSLRVHGLNSLASYWIPRRAKPLLSASQIKSSGIAGLPDTVSGSWPIKKQRG
jgi:hypothetical protein